MSEPEDGSVPAGRGEDALSGFTGLTDEILPALIARLRASRLGELEVRDGEWRVRLRRDPAARSRAASPASAGVDVSDAGASPGIVARSPAVGYFSPVSELMVGASIQTGDLLGTIDVLGIAQDVTAPSDGMVTGVLAEEGQAVEYGQALVEIDPLESLTDLLGGEL